MTLVDQPYFLLGTNTVLCDDWLRLVEALVWRGLTRPSSSYESWFCICSWFSHGDKLYQNRTIVWAEVASVWYICRTWREMAFYSPRMELEETYFYRHVHDRLILSSGPPGLPGPPAAGDQSYSAKTKLQSESRWETRLIRMQQQHNCTRKQWALSRLQGCRLLLFFF